MAHHDSSRRTTDLTPYEAAERSARMAYGRLLASLCRSGADITQAEDALGDAFMRALERWSNHGVPASPEAWLLTTARRLLIDQARHRHMVRRSMPDLIKTLDDVVQQVTATDGLADRRLELMMMCAHPAVSAAARAPLMLQTVLGMTADTMSKAFLVSPATLGQRLARAKRHLAKRHIEFVELSSEQYDARASDVLEAIYAAFATSWNSVDDAKDRRQGLAHEAIWLAQILCQRLPDHAEAHGLLSLMLFAQSRVQARRGENNEFIPLSEQTRAHWDWELIATAEYHLRCASKLNSIGRFQLEAAIQSNHVQCAEAGPDWQAIVHLYDALMAVAPTLATLVGRAAALSETRGPQAGLTALEQVSLEQQVRFQPYWAVKAHLLEALNRQAEAAKAYRQAIGLCEDDSVRQFLLDKHSALSES